MNSKVPSNSVINDFGLLSKTQGRSYQKQEGRQAALPEAFCFTISFHHLERVWSLHISHWDGSDLGVRLWDFLKLTLGKAQSIPRGHRSQQAPSCLRAKDSACRCFTSLCSCVEKRTGSTDLQPSQSKETFSCYLFTAWVGAFPERGSSPHSWATLPPAGSLLLSYQGTWWRLSRTAYSDESESINRC